MLQHIKITGLRDEEYLTGRLKGLLPNEKMEENNFKRWCLKMSASQQSGERSNFHLAAVSWAGLGCHSLLQLSGVDEDDL